MVQVHKLRIHHKILLKCKTQAGPLGEELPSVSFHWGVRTPFWKFDRRQKEIISKWHRGFICLVKTYLQTFAQGNSLLATEKYSLYCPCKSYYLIYIPAAATFQT